jgi:hypothetical protein
MNAQFLEIPAGVMEQIKSDPSLIEPLLEATLLADAESSFNKLLDQVREGGPPPSGIAGYEGMVADLEAQAPLYPRRSPPRSSLQPVRSLDLGKPWHGLHYLLSGQVMPVPGESAASQAVLGGVEIGEDFTGYGRARLFEPALVAEISRALARPNLNDDMNARFDRARMTALKVYSSRWDDDDRQELLDAFGELRDFYAQAAARNSAVLTSMT